VTVDSFNASAPLNGNSSSNATTTTTVMVASASASFTGTVVVAVLLAIVVVLFFLSIYLAYVSTPEGESSRFFLDSQGLIVINWIVCNTLSYGRSSAFMDCGGGIEDLAATAGSSMEGWDDVRIFEAFLLAACFHRMIPWPRIRGLNFGWLIIELCLCSLQFVQMFSEAPPIVQVRPRCSRIFPFGPTSDNQKYMRSQIFGAIINVLAYVSCIRGWVSSEFLVWRGAWQRQDSATQKALRMAASAASQLPVPTSLPVSFVVKQTERSQTGEAQREEGEAAEDQATAADATVMPSRQSSETMDLGDRSNRVPQPAVLVNPAATGMISGGLARSNLHFRGPLRDGAGYHLGTSVSGTDVSSMMVLSSPAELSASAPPSAYSNLYQTSEQARGTATQNYMEYLMGSGAKSGTRRAAAAGRTVSSLSAAASATAGGSSSSSAGRFDESAKFHWA
jgi:hypothetical protein